jgi:Fe2+ or Zn2+ uptake regulation protein
MPRRGRPRINLLAPAPGDEADVLGIEADLELLQQPQFAVGRSWELFVENDALLRRHGINVTAQRLAVVRAVSDRPHSTAEDIYNAVRAAIGAISRQAVYDALAALTDKGLIRRIQSPGSPARYEDRVGDNHHHLICRTCSRMVDVDCAVGDTPCLTAADDSGYEVDEAEVIYWGRCPKCAGSALTRSRAEAGRAACGTS